MSNEESATKPEAVQAINILQQITSTLSNPSLPPLPDYALRHAPLMYLYDKEDYWPGNPLDFIASVHPETRVGDALSFAGDLTGKLSLLDSPTINVTDTFLVSNEDPIKNTKTPFFTSLKGKPDANGKSEAPCWIICVDKSAAIKPGVIDVFYFFFYPYNFGNAVVGTNYGNHVGDWEHVMIRFENEKPFAAHLSAHSDGHAYAWKTLEKRGDRPVVYSAGGSHALYGKPGTHFYSVPIVGPSDKTSKGPLWDPTLNYVPAAYSLSTSTFGNLYTPPGATSPPIPASDVLYVLNFKGRWGNSFSNIRNSVEKWYNVVQRRLALLMWSEGPTGPRDKSLERTGMNRTSDRLEPKL